MGQRQGQRFGFVRSRVLTFGTAAESKVKVSGTMATVATGMGSGPWASLAPRTLIMYDTLTSMLRSCPPLLLTGLPRSVCLPLKLFLLPPGVSQAVRLPIAFPHLRRERPLQSLHRGGKTQVHLCPLSLGT